MGRTQGSVMSEALSEADNFCAEVDTVRQLQTRLDEVEAENRSLKARLAVWRTAGDAR